MNQKHVVFTLTCALALAGTGAAVASGDPLAQTKADLAKLTADATAAKATIVADGTDMARLRRDAKQGLFALKADRKLLFADAAAARKAGGDKTDLRSLLQAARTQMKQFRAAVRTAYTQAARQNKGSNGSKGSHRSQGRPSGRGSDDNGSGG